MQIAIIGAGSWGTALGIHAATRHEVALVARDPQQVVRMREERQNTRYLPGFLFSDNLHVHSSIPDTGVDLVVIATPLAALEQTLLSPALQRLGTAASRVPVVWLCKGLDMQGRMPHQIAHSITPTLLCGTLTGPSFAQEVASAAPTALVAASASEQLRQLCVQAFHFRHVRIYGSTDIVGAEVGGAVKNVLAIAVGLCDAMQLGLNARAALITRALAEMSRFAVALGANVQTLMGLSGLGDLVLTATGDLSRNRRVGMLLAQGMSAAEATHSLGHVAEGVRCAPYVVQKAQQLGIQMPVCQAVVALLSGAISPQQALASLMERQAKSEL